MIYVAINVVREVELSATVTMTEAEFSEWERKLNSPNRNIRETAEAKLNDRANVIRDWVDDKMTDFKGIEAMGEVAD